MLPIDVHGAIARERDLAEHDELLELTRILEKVDRDECSPRASEIVAYICKSSLSTLRERISLLKKEDSKRLWQAALYGFASLFQHRSPTPIINLDLMNQYEFYLRRSMRAIGILLHYLGYNIVPSAGPDEGPLRSGCVNQISTLVWCDPEQNSYAIQRQIIDWAHGRKSPASLFVIADGTVGDFDNQIIYPNRLGDITTARDQQANDGLDISEPRVGKVFGLSLRKLETRLFASKNNASEDQVKSDLTDLVAGSLHSG